MIDSHKNSEARGLLAPVAELASRQRMAVVMVMLLSKSGDQGRQIGIRPQGSRYQG
jgi:hypothetical protein